MDDATFSSDGPGGVNVISSHHPHSDARTLALSDGVRYLRGAEQTCSLKNPMPIWLIDTDSDMMDHNNRCYHMKIDRNTLVPQAAQGPLSPPQ